MFFVAGWGNLAESKRNIRSKNVQGGTEKGNQGMLILKNNLLRVVRANNLMGTVLTDMECLFLLRRGGKVGGTLDITLVPSLYRNVEWRSLLERMLSLEIEFFAG